MVLDLMGDDPCFRKVFMPTDQELMIFLYNKINGKPLPKDATFLECDLYGDKNPWEIWESFRGTGTNSFGGRDLFFFTTLKKKFLSGSRLVRTIGLGSWGGEDTGKVIVAKGTNRRFGMKKRFRFEKSGTNHDGAWIMHEYSLDSSLIRNPSASNYVLCRFIKKQTDILQKTSYLRTAKEDTRHHRTIVLGLAATTISACKDVGLREDINKRPGRRIHGQLQLKSGERRIKYVETTTTTARTHSPQLAGINHCDHEDQEDGDLNMSWPQLFALQLIKMNQGQLMQDEEISMIPNNSYKDMFGTLIKIES